MNREYQPWREALTMRGLHLAEAAFRRAPADLTEAGLRRLLDTGLRHADGRDFVMLVAKTLKERWNDFAPAVRRRFVENLFGHTMLLAGGKRAEIRAEMGDAPLLMVISPTMRCNLACAGCYSANYDRRDAIDTATFDRVLTEAKQMGIHFVVVSGGEPYLRADLLEMFAKHPDILFMTYTNGTIIHRDKLAPKLAELGNVMPAISVEGFAAETDARRGAGTFDHVVGAMSALRRAGVIFGFSATPMRANNELLVADEFVEYYLNLGAFFGWYFHYMPVGRNPNLDLMPTVEQRRYRMDRIRDIRAKYPIAVADFWTDGTLVGGCLSAGRVYFHINAQGGVEPCVFHQFSVDNVLNKPLREALNSPYFQFMRGKIREEIDNPLTPCPVCDNPAILREAVARFAPRASQGGGTATVKELAAGLDDYSQRLHATMDPIWRELRQGRPAGDGTTRRAPDDPVAKYEGKRDPKIPFVVTDSSVQEAIRVTGKRNGSGEVKKAAAPSRGNGNGNGNGKAKAAGRKPSAPSAKPTSPAR